MKVSYTLGRLLFGGFFLYNGIHHLLERKTMSRYVEAKHVPMPDAAVTATGVALTLGGASLMLGIKPKFGRRRIPSRNFPGDARFLESAGSGKAAARND
jgi:putative oxidoreductase